MPESTRFTRWLELAPAGHFPPLPGVVQCKVARLIEYPGGRSGMVWYGAGEVAAVVTRLCDALPRRLPGEPILVRYRPADHPEAEAAALLARFERRFGAPPKLQDALDG